MPSALPPCPITGRPALRRVHGVAASVLRRMWRFAGAGDVGHLLPLTGQIVLYESDTGLYFFVPRTGGDADFYRRFYGVHGALGLVTTHPGERAEFELAARHIPAGALVLDVGCGEGAFADYVPGRTYRGLDPYVGQSARVEVVRETLDQHLTKAAGTYDAVTAFQVIEHVPDPKGFCTQLIALLRPGGTLVLGVPLHPSPLTEIPNFLNNAPPHHLTWWTPSALAALAEALDLIPVEIIEVPCSPHEAFVNWMHRFSLMRVGDQGGERYLGHRWSWHINLAVCYVLARAATRWFPAPRDARPNNVILVARKPLSEGLAH